MKEINGSGRVDILDSKSFSEVTVARYASSVVQNVKIRMFVVCGPLSPHP